MPSWEKDNSQSVASLPITRDLDWAFVLFPRSNAYHREEYFKELDSYILCFGTPTSVAAEARPAIGDLKWLKLIEDQGLVATTPKQLAGYIVGINSLIRSGEFKLLDHALQKIEPNSMSIELMIAIVRSTYPVRRKLDNWAVFLEKIAQQISGLGKDSQKLLAGLRA